MLFSWILCIFEYFHNKKERNKLLYVCVSWSRCSFWWSFSIIIQKAQSASILACVPPKGGGSIQSLGGDQNTGRCLSRTHESGSPETVNEPLCCQDPPGVPCSMHLRTIPSRRGREQCLIYPGNSVGPGQLIHSGMHIIRTTDKFPADAKKPHVQLSKVLSGCIFHTQLIATAGVKGAGSGASVGSGTAGVVWIQVQICFWLPPGAEKPHRAFSSLTLSEGTHPQWGFLWIWKHLM